MTTTVFQINYDGDATYWASIAGAHPQRLCTWAWTEIEPPEVLAIITSTLEGIGHHVTTETYEADDHLTDADGEPFQDADAAFDLLAEQIQDKGLDAIRSLTRIEGETL